ncbi:hypothetical protein ABT364_27720 [Massilia sp. SR12]
MAKLTIAAQAALLAACALAGCAKEPAVQTAPPAAAQVAAAAPAAAAAAPQALSDKEKRARMMELLRAVYGAEAARDNYMLVEMPTPDQREVVGIYRLEPAAMHELADGRVAVVANAQMADDKEEAMSSHAMPGLLSAYLLRQVDGQWRVEARHENVAELGSFGQFGEVEWVMLGEGRPGFTVQHGGTWQGYTISHLSVFDLGDRAMHDLTGGVAIYSSDEGACGGANTACWTTESKWQFEKRAGARYDDLVLRFKGFEDTRPDGAPEDAARERKEHSGMARYKFDGRKYVLVEGENIVRGF